MIKFVIGVLVAGMLVVARADGAQAWGFGGHGSHSYHGFHGYHSR